MKAERLATGGAIGASLLIASCCVAPTLFLLFGVSVGALGSLSALEPYRPAFIAVGGAALLYAGRRIYSPARSDAEDCADDSCAPEAPARRRTRRLFTFGAVIFVVAIAYPHVLEALL